MANTIDRRTLVAGAAAMGAGALAARAASASEGSSASGSGAASSWMPAAWDKEADAVVIGFGQTGGTAALRLSDLGDDVIILEKMEKSEAGGDFSISCGFSDLGFRGGVEMTAGEVVKGTAYYLSEDEAEEYLGYESHFQEMLAEVGAEEKFWEDFPEEPHYYVTLPDNPDSVGNSGWYWYQCYVNTVEQRDNIEVMYETPGLDLVQDPQTKEVLGVKAGSPDAPIYVKARKGVYVATGGFESDDELFRGTYNVGLYVPVTGHPAITGDGLKMCLRAGAKHTHINSAVEYLNACFKKASQDAGTAIAMGQGVGGFNSYGDGYIIVNRYGERFGDETHAYMHNHTTPIPWFTLDAEWFGSTDSIGYRNSPCWIIFDQEELESGPLGRQRGDGGWGYNLSDPAREPKYVWSEDNQKEVENGYLLKADTLEELCAMLTDELPDGTVVSPDYEATKASIEKYNELCASGAESDEFGRTTLKAISMDGPFYGAAMAMGVIYTTGGINTTVRTEVVDWDGNVIPRLFAGGNLASPFVWRTPASHGAVATGWAAAESIDTLEPQA